MDAGSRGRSETNFWCKRTQHAKEKNVGGPPRSPQFIDGQRGEDDHLTMPVCYVNIGAERGFVSERGRSRRLLRAPDCLSKEATREVAGHSLNSQG